ncbi:MAG: hypothetical protein GY799_01350 [Desulfobulbaceae bacterium]|nr:hypothetical protein [Desulfobulbaceae bacterium]
MHKLNCYYVNVIEVFANQPSSGENITPYIAIELQKKIVNPSIKVFRFSCWESDDSCAMYIV